MGARGLFGGDGNVLYFDVNIDTVQGLESA